MRAAARIGAGWGRDPLSPIGALMSEQYWFCLKHRSVEGADGCKAADRLGPYASSAEAARALDKVEERNEDWDNDPRWQD
jgi:hypothetical protein